MLYRARRESLGTNLISHVDVYNIHVIGHKLWVVSSYKESCNNKPMYGYIYMLPNLSPSLNQECMTFYHALLPNLYKVQCL